VPFVRTLGECAKVIELLAANGLKRGENGLRLIMMCELPSNAISPNNFSNTSTDSRSGRTILRSSRSDWIATRTPLRTRSTSAIRR